MDNDAQVAEEGRRLLLDILPLFASNPDRVDSTKDLYFQAYYYMICTEAKILEDFLKDCNTKASQYADILEKVLKLFENLVKPDILSRTNSFPRIHNRKYERLPALRDRLQVVKTNCGSLLDLQKFVHFGDRRDETRDIHWALIQCNKAFSENEDNLPSWGFEDKLHKRSPAYEVREYAATLYQTMLDKLPGCEHEAKLYLARYENSEELDSEISFELLFSTHTPRWQESKIGMMVQGNKSTSSRVRFDASSIKKRFMREIEGKICSLIESTSKLRVYLYMLVDSNRKIYRVLSETPQRRGSAQTHDTVSMKAIIEKLEEDRITKTHDRKNPILGRKYKRIIAVLLSHALLQYCGSAWLIEHWDKNSISFLRDSRGDRLVISTGLKPQNSEPDLDAESRMHGYPGVLALAVLMLEMELGKTIETARSEQEEFVYDEESNINTDFNVAWNMFEDDEIQDDTIPGFKDAVKACLSFSYWNENTEPDDLINHREKLYDDITLRRKIYQEIIMPLERELFMSFPNLNLDEPLRFAFWDRVKVLSQPTHQDQKAVLNPTRTLPDVLLKQSHNNGTSILDKLSPSAGLSIITPDQVFFHDVPIPASDERQVRYFFQVRVELEMLTIFLSRKLSKGWMEDYISARDSLIDRIDYSNKFETSRVKIAVLDTGIDWSDSYIRGAKDRIMEWKNWADDRQEQDSQQRVHDDAGHGTHVTALLLKTAPEAKIYVSRVADQNGATISAERIAEAIEHTVKVWEVDIITMSFGFRKPITIIDKAIKYAFSRDVIMFAATSNDGGNEDVAFPASSYGIVIGVNSTDTWGGKSNFTPNILPLSENFSTLGEAVESSWPKHLKQGQRQYRSGTSYATPIAAGTAANALFYVRMKIENEEKVKEAATCRGMKKLLLSMAAPIGGYSYVRPWVLWRKDDEDILAQIRTALG